MKPIQCLRADRGGVAAVEFAIVAPVLLLISLALVETTHLLDVRADMLVATREGARLASMDRSEVLQPGQTTNQKIVQDVRNLLNACGLNGGSAAIRIVDPADHVTPINLDDPANEYELFELIVQVPYEDVTTWYQSIMGSPTVQTSVVFRNGRV